MPLPHPTSSTRDAWEIPLPAIQVAQHFRLYSAMAGVFGGNGIVVGRHRLPQAVNRQVDEVQSTAVGGVSGELGSFRLTTTMTHCSVSLCTLGKVFG